jgi:DNA-binding transcriptional regulator YdaS (Cro superfamily)
MTKQKLIDRLQQMIRAAGSQKKLATKIGYSQVYLSDIYNGKREPSDRFCSAIGFRKVATYEEIENEKTL